MQKKEKRLGKLKDFVTMTYDQIFGIQEDSKWTLFAKAKIKNYEKTGKCEFDDGAEVLYYRYLLSDFKELMGLRKISGLKVIEVGSGMGMLAILMASEGAQAWLMDRDRQWMRYAKILGKRVENSTHFGKLNYIVDELNQKFLKKYEGNFDTVYSVGVIEHYSVSKAVSIVRDMKKLATRGGVVIVGVPNFFSPDTIAIWHEYGKFGERYYTKELLNEVMCVAGLKRIKVITSAYSFPHWKNPEAYKKMSYTYEKKIGRSGLGFLYLAIGYK